MPRRGFITPSGARGWVARQNVKAQAYPPLDADLGRELRARFVEDVAYVERHLGRPIPTRREEP